MMQTFKGSSPLLKTDCMIWISNSIITFLLPTKSLPSTEELLIYLFSKIFLGWLFLTCLILPQRKMDYILFVMRWMTHPEQILQLWMTSKTFRLIGLMTRTALCSQKERLGFFNQRIFKTKNGSRVQPSTISSMLCPLSSNTLLSSDWLLLSLVLGRTRSRRWQTYQRAVSPYLVGTWQRNVLPSSLRMSQF